ncbi:MAG: hypothetical protein L0Y54_11900 [Sporichthyaceae bacterium]|nr:hypothetical protein [Sporichthyaceae bacterium]
MTHQLGTVAPSQATHNHDTRESGPARRWVRSLAPLLAASAVVVGVFVAGRWTASPEPAPLVAGQEYVIQVPGDDRRVEATYLGPCPAESCSSAALPYSMFQVGDRRVALFLVDWIQPAG